MVDANTSFRQLLAGSRFGYGIEIVSTRGLETPESPRGLASVVRTLADHPRCDWVSMTDNPGGGPMLPPDWLARQVPEQREKIVIHLTCKDLNRSGLESAAWRYASEGLRNILALTGDYPTGGFGGVASGVFDLDSLSLIALLAQMNRGLRVPGRGGGQEALPATDFFIGCAVSPFKRHERELMPQYFKLLRKIRTGAHWVLPQLGYDMRKFHEVRLLLAARQISVPVIGNVYRLTRGIAKVFHSGKLAGCVLTDALLEQVERYAAGPDKGKKYFNELAAKQLAVFKGLGFAAGYLGGITKPEVFDDVVELAESYGPDDWREFLREIQFAQPDEFFLFDHDPASGLATPERLNPEYVRSLRSPAKPKEVTAWYKLSRQVHEWAFTRGKGLYGLMQKLFGRLDRKPGVMASLAHQLERTSKQLGYGCKDCGDCSLPDCGYLCPLAGCSKGSRNGPCGGSCGGQCELQDKECFWARVYQRLKYYGESERLAEGPVVVYNAALKNTSSWANTYLDRDHHAPPPAADSKDSASSYPDTKKSL